MGREEEMSENLSDEVFLCDYFFDALLGTDHQYFASKFKETSQ